MRDMHKKISLIYKKIFIKLGMQKSASTVNVKNNMNNNLVHPFNFINLCNNIIVINARTVCAIANKNGYISSKLKSDIILGNIVNGKENIAKKGCLMSFSHPFMSV